MKSIGIVRRIDELGRIVIPKEIRKNLCIREGDSMEIFLDYDRVILTKFSSLRNINVLVQLFTDSIFSLLGYNIIITDTDDIIAISGSHRKDYANKNISNDLVNKINRRSTFYETRFQNVELINQKSIFISYVLDPIIVAGDVIGSVIIFDEKNSIGDIEKKLAKILSSFFQKYLED